MAHQLTQRLPLAFQMVEAEVVLKALRLVEAAGLNGSIELENRLDAAPTRQQEDLAFRERGSLRSR